MFTARPPLHLVSQDESLSYENPDVARLFLELGLEVNAQDKSLNTPLHFACSKGNVETARVLLDHGAHVNARNSNDQTPMHKVPQRLDHCSTYDSRIAQLMLERGAEVNARDKDQATPLHFACLDGCFASAREFLDHGADVNARSNNDETPLHCVSQSLSSDKVYELSASDSQLLSGRGADSDAIASAKHDATMLVLAGYKSKLETARLLLDYGAYPDVQNADGQTPLHGGSQSSDHRKGAPPLDPHRVVQLLLERGVNVNARDKDQETPLHLASYNLDLKTVRVLLDNGAEGDARNADGQTPLHRVSQSPKNGEYYGSRAAQLLLERGVDVDARDNDQTTPLHLASHCGHADVAKVLLDHRARAKTEDVGGQTPLHLVLLGHQNYKSWSMSSHLEQVDPGRAVRFAQQLLERGADVNARNKDWETPLHLASHLRLHQMARFLLNHGADVNVKNSEGKTPLQLASGRKGKAMKRLLLEYSTKKA
jgi:ankyrin repeat protein